MDKGQEQYYREFEAGTKHHGLRADGPRWNEKVCRVGRPVVISWGYAKHSRMTGEVVSFDKIEAEDLIKNS